MQIGVLWESGDVTFPCEVGWEHHTNPTPHVRIVAGGEITGRYVTPRDPKPKPWPTPIEPLNIDWTSIGWDPGAEWADHTRPA